MRTVDPSRNTTSPPCGVDSLPPAAISIVLSVIWLLITRMFPFHFPADPDHAQINIPHLVSHHTSEAIYENPEYDTGRRTGVFS